jgi:hypothetical protein
VHSFSGACIIGQRLLESIFSGVVYRLEAKKSIMKVNQPSCTMNLKHLTAAPKTLTPFVLTIQDINIRMNEA